MDIRRLLGFIVFGILLVEVAFSQTVVKHFTVDNGLPSTEIYFIHQDVEGYFWICTDRGISQYDGTSFTNYSTADGLTHNTIFKCFEDKNSDDKTILK